MSITSTLRNNPIGQLLSGKPVAAQGSLHQIINSMLSGKNHLQIQGDQAASFKDILAGNSQLSSELTNLIGKLTESNLDQLVDSLEQNGINQNQAKEIREFGKQVQMIAHGNALADLADSARQNTTESVARRQGASAKTAKSARDAFAAN